MEAAFLAKASISALGMEWDRESCFSSVRTVVVSSAISARDLAL